MNNDNDNESDNYKSNNVIDSSSKLINRSL